MPRTCRFKRGRIVRDRKWLSLLIWVFPTVATETHSCHSDRFRYERGCCYRVCALIRNLRESNQKFVCISRSILLTCFLLFKSYFSSVMFWTPWTVNFSLVCFLSLSFFFLLPSVSKLAWKIWQQLWAECSSWHNLGSNLQPQNYKTTLTTELQQPRHFCYRKKCFVWKLVDFLTKLDQKNDSHISKNWFLLETSAFLS